MSSASSDSVPNPSVKKRGARLVAGHYVEIVSAPMGGERGEAMVMLLDLDRVDYLITGHLGRFGYRMIGEADTTPFPAVFDGLYDDVLEVLEARHLNKASR